MQKKPNAQNYTIQDIYVESYFICLIHAGSIAWKLGQKNGLKKHGKIRDSHSAHRHSLSFLWTESPRPLRHPAGKN